MKKMIKINQSDTGEYSFEEIVEKYQNYLHKTCRKYFGMLKSVEQHSVHIDYDDMYQYALISMNKAYSNYDYNFKTEGYEDSNDRMGFYPYMDRSISGDLSRISRDVLKMRKKDYNIHEINLSSFDAPIAGKDDSKDLFLQDIIKDDSDSFKDLLDSLEVSNVLEHLPERDRNILYDRFFKEMTQLELAEKYNVSQAQISRALVKILKQIRERVEIMKKKTSRTINRVKPQELSTNTAAKSVMPTNIASASSISPIETPKYPQSKIEPVLIQQFPTETYIPIVAEPVNNALNGLRIKTMEIEFDSFIGNFKEDGVILDLYAYEEEDLNILRIEDLERFKSDIDKAINLLKMFKK